MTKYECRLYDGYYLYYFFILLLIHREAAGDIYHQELSKELAEFLQPIMAQKGGMMTLTDIYCIFNRARGIGELLAVYTASRLSFCM